MLATMKPGAVLVDVAIDQGGCFETSHATTHAEPTYLVDGIVHYCVANMPGAVARTSTYALNNVTLPMRCASPISARGAARRSPPCRRAERPCRPSHVRGCGARTGLRIRVFRRNSSLS
jgi:alanine dehydrogenase